MYSFVFITWFCATDSMPYKNSETRMHSSRMLTGHSLTVCQSLLHGEGGRCLLQGVCSRGEGGLLQGGVSTRGGVGGLGGVYSQGGCVCSGGVCFRGSVYSGGGVSALGGCLLLGGFVASQHALRQTPPLWTESQTPVKTLPWPNFVAAGNQVEGRCCTLLKILWILLSQSERMLPKTHSCGS